MLAFTLLSAAALMAPFVQAANHTIIVGGAAGLVFTPSNITAQINDFVTFVFQTKNHTVTQSGFASPCSLLTNATTQTVGFDSGYVPVAANATQFPAWTIQVTVSTPLWFYCKQGNHCQSGMVGAINAAATGNKTYSAFRSLAMTSSSSGAATSIAATATGIGAGAAGSGSVSAGAASSAIAAANQNGVSSINPNSAYSTTSLSSAVVALAGVAVVAFSAL